MHIENPSKSNLKKAAGLLQAGELVAFPTETVYGLGADATNDKAVAEIFEVKGRPEFNPLIVHVASIKMAQNLVQWNASAEKLARIFWPGPLTLVLPRLKYSPVSLLVSAGGDSLGIRMPDNLTALALITASGVPLAAPSANRSGRVSPTRAQHVAEELGDAVPLILDGGPCTIGIESTVLDLTGEEPILLRSGYMTRANLEKALGCEVKLQGAQNGALKSPGLLQSHYAPALPVRLNVTKPMPDEALLAFGPNIPNGAKQVMNLSMAGDLKEAAANLFAHLRALDRPEFTTIAVMPIPEEGLGVAINDRLTRAAVSSFSAHST